MTFRTRLIIAAPSALAAVVAALAGHYEVALMPAMMVVFVLLY